MPGPGHGICDGVCRGRRLTYEHEFSPRNSVSRGSWGDGCPFEDAEKINDINHKDNSPGNSVMHGLLEDTEQKSAPSETVTNLTQQLDAAVNMNANSNNPDQNSVVNAQSCSAQSNKLSPVVPSVKTSTNMKSPMMQSSVIKQSDKFPARLGNQGFLSPRTIADSLIKAHRESTISGNQDSEPGSKGTQRSRSEQRSLKPMKPSRSTGSKRTISKTRLPTSADRNPGKPKSRDHSTDSQSSNLK